MSEIKKIVLIGAGNVATHLGAALKKAGFTIVQVYSRTNTSARSLSKKLDCAFTSDPKKIALKADLYIIAVKDDKITSLAKKIRLKDKIVVHTSGSMEMRVLKKISSNYGVLYPLQTFSKARESEFSKIPICIEGSNRATEKELLALANKISRITCKINSDQRSALHLAAVFACNFSNHLYALAADLLKKDRLPFSLLHPLILETAEKAIANDPTAVQTGPAMRGDKKIMAYQLQLLKKKKDAAKIYKLLSKSIVLAHKKK